MESATYIHVILKIWFLFPSKVLWQNCVIHFKVIEAVLIVLRTYLDIGHSVTFESSTRISFCSNIFTTDLYFTFAHLGYHNSTYIKHLPDLFPPKKIWGSSKKSFAVILQGFYQKNHVLNAIFLGTTTSSLIYSAINLVVTFTVDKMLKIHSAKIDVLHNHISKTFGVKS